MEACQKRLLRGIWLSVSILIILEAGLEGGEKSSPMRSGFVSILIILEAGLEVQAFFYFVALYEVSILIILEAGLEDSLSLYIREKIFSFQS